jgi:hypothetical protein
MIPSNLSGPGSEAKEKCYKEQTVGNNQSEAIRKRPLFLTQIMHFLLLHFLYHSASEIHFCDSISHCALLILLVMGQIWAPQEQERMSF